MKSTMKKYAWILCALFAAPVVAQEDVAALTITKRCNACHELSDPSLGPPWQAIAARHAARRDLMVDVLASKIVYGGGGNWGNVPMVPNQRVSPIEARRMAAWILSLSASN
jgi:cytochrome c